MASEMKTPLLPESKYEILRDRVLVRWNQMLPMFVERFGTLQFLFFFGGVMIRDGESHGKSFVQLFRFTGFFSKVSPSDPPPQNNSWASKFSCDVMLKKSAWLVAGGTKGLTLTLAWQEIISPKRLMDDTTHPCFYSRCMVLVLISRVICHFGDVNIRDSKPNSGEKAVRSKAWWYDGQGRVVAWWYDRMVDGMVTLDGNAMGGGCIEWSHNKKWLIPDVTKNVSWRNNFDVIWKDWGLEERTTSQSFCCVSISVLCVLFVYPPLFFCPSDKKSQQKSVRHAAVYRFESGSHFYGYWPSHVASCFSAGYETESLSLHLHENLQEILNKNPKSQGFLVIFIPKRVLIFEGFFWWFTSSFSFFAPFFWVVVVVVVGFGVAWHRFPSDGEKLLQEWTGKIVSPPKSLEAKDGEGNDGQSPVIWRLHIF